MFASFKTPRCTRARGDYVTFDRVVIPKIAGDVPMPKLEWTVKWTEKPGWSDWYSSDCDRYDVMYSPKGRAEYLHPDDYMGGNGLKTDGKDWCALRTDGPDLVRLGWFETSDDAKKACEEHLEKETTGGV